MKRRDLSVPAVLKSVRYFSKYSCKKSTVA
jgi:hypothetical protein